MTLSTVPTSPHLVLAGTTAGYAAIWDTRVSMTATSSGALCWRLCGTKAHPMEILGMNNRARPAVGRCTAVAPCGAYGVISGSSTGELRLWDLRKVSTCTSGGVVDSQCSPPALIRSWEIRLLIADPEIASGEIACLRPSKTSPSCFWLSTTGGFVGQFDTAECAVRSAPKMEETGDEEGPKGSDTRADFGRFLQGTGAQDSVRSSANIAAPSPKFDIVANDAAIAVPRLNTHSISMIRCGNRKSDGTAGGGDERSIKPLGDFELAGRKRSRADELPAPADGRWLASIQMDKAPICCTWHDPSGSLLVGDIEGAVWRMS